MVLDGRATCEVPGRGLAGHSGVFQPAQGTMYEMRTVPDAGGCSQTLSSSTDISWSSGSNVGKDCAFCLSFFMDCVVVADRGGTLDMKDCVPRGRRNLSEGLSRKEMTIKGIDGSSGSDWT